MSRPVHGRCAVGRRCPDAGVIFRWTGGPKLRDAACPTCKLPLRQTAPSLAFAAVRDQVPPYQPGRAPMRRPVLPGGNATRCDCCTAPGVMTLAIDGPGGPTVSPTVTVRACRACGDEAIADGARRVP